MRICTLFLLQFLCLHFHILHVLGCFTLVASAFFPPILYISEGFIYRACVYFSYKSPGVRLRWDNYLLIAGSKKQINVYVRRFLQQNIIKEM